MSEINWEEINSNIQQGTTSWIQILNKKQVLEVFQKYSIPADETFTLEHLRKTLIRYVKTRSEVKDNTKQEISKENSQGEKFENNSGGKCSGENINEAENTKVTMAFVCEIEPYKKKDNWPSFAAQLDAFILLNDVDGAKKAAVLLTKLSSDVFGELRTECQPEDILKLTYDQLKEKLTNLYEPAKNEYLQRFAFRQRKQKPTETIQEYILALRGMAQKCKFSTNDLENQMKDQLISGVYNQMIRYELLKSADNSWKDLIALAKTVEIADAKAPGLENTTGSNNSAQEKTEVHKINFRRRNSGEQSKTTNARYTQQWSDHRKNSPSSQQPSTSRGATRTGQACYCCGKFDHVKAQCSLRFKYCSECGQKGHIYKMCSKNKDNNRSNSQHFINAESSEPGHEELGENECTDEYDNTEQRFESDFFLIENAEVEVNNIASVPPQFETIRVNNIPLEMEVDSGALISAISVECYKQFFSSIPLQASDMVLRAYNKQPIQAIGLITVSIEKSIKVESQKLYVIKQGGHPIVGRGWLAKLGMWPLKFSNMGVNELKYCESTKSFNIESLRTEFKDVFKKGFGKFNKGRLSLKLQPGTQPKFIPPRKIAFSLRAKVEQELRRLQVNNIIEPIEFSDWGTPVVPVLKADDTVRLCGNFKITLNPNLKIDHFPSPRPETVFYELRGGNKFSTLDLAEAYQQLLLDEDSQQLVVISTHVGLFKYKRLPYGVSTGPGSFQRILTSLLLGMPGVVVYIDDVIITAAGTAEHINKLREVLKRLNDAGLRLKFEKCRFLQDEVTYLGYRIDKNGIHPIKRKIESVSDAPKPENVSQLRSFLGSVNYYSRFIPNMATKLRPLYNCLEKKGGFNWLAECDKAFLEKKNELMSDKFLIHFDPKKEIILTCDASPHGVSAVLSHRLQNQYDCPIHYASRTLTASERNYTQLDREGLAIIFGVKTFFEYLFGNIFLLQTDNAALSRIFHPEKSIPEIAGARIQRWAIYLSAFRYKIKHIKGSENYADWLSRMPLPTCETAGKITPILDDADNVCIKHVQAYDFATLDWKRVQQLTRQDQMLCKVLRFCVDGWPEKQPIEKEILSYWRKREALSIESNCILWGHRVVIPEKLRKLVINELHFSHFGVSKMKALARSFVWWPSLDSDLEEVTRSCLRCLETKKMPIKIPLTPWAWPTTPWHRVHADFLGPIAGKMVLLMIDSHSKWPEAFIMSSMGEEATVATFQEVFTRYGFPAHLVTDNFKTFVGQACQRLFKHAGIRHSTSPPHCPATNGAAENLVDTFKRKVICMINNGLSLEKATKQFLFDYRITPHMGTNQSPAKLMLGRELRTRFSLLRPRETQQIIYTHQNRQIKNHKGSRMEQFEIGDPVMVTDYRGGKTSWIKGTVVKEIVPGVTFLVEVDSSIVWKRHSNQMRQCNENLTDFRGNTPKVSTTVAPPEQSVLRRSERIRNQRSDHE